MREINLEVKYDGTFRRMPYLRQGETGTSTIYLTLPTDFQGYSYVIVFQPVTGDPISTVELTPDENQIISYLLTSVFTAEVGTIGVELNCYDESDNLVKSAEMSIEVKESLSGAGDVIPTDYVPWYVLTAQKASEAEEDATQTALDRIATGEDVIQTGKDRVATGEDRAQTALDRIDTGEDRVATGEDRSAVNSALSTFSTVTLPAAVAEVEAEGDAQILFVQFEGTTQKGLVTGEGNAQVLRVTGEGDTQEQRVTTEGTTQVGLVQASGASLQETIEGADAINTTLTNTTIPNAQSINTTLSVTTTPAAQAINGTLTNDTIPAAQAINTTLTNTTIPAAQQAEESLQEVIDNSQIGSLDELKTSAKLTLVDAINENSLAFSRIAAPKYGVSGVGGSAPALTMLWDLVGKSVAVGTDLAGATNDLDTLAPFNRRKCVGSWVSGGNEAIFVPQSYYGDPDYIEDGSKGDYVAVDIQPFWWYESSDGSTIGVSPGPQYGWEIHPICVNKRTGIVRDHTYIPAFALALKNGKAVSLPGYRNERGNYKTLWDAAKTYDGTAKQYAILEPSEIDHYEWLLQTIEFATTNPQTVMRGAVDMRYADDPITALTPTTGVVSATAGAAFVIGQNVYIGTSYSADVQASHKIDNIEACDETGNTAGSGYYLLTMTPYAGATDITTITNPKIATRPWNTGACSGVLSPSGSPVSNSSGKYPARYRWRENPYGNQNMTCVDLMNRLTGGNLEWYYLADPLAYYPADVNKPDEAVLIGEGSAWTKLAVTPENYADGYIKKRGSDPALKHIKVPTLTAGASDNTYFSDYASLVYSPLVRSVRRRGSPRTLGSNAGPCYVNAANAPGTSYWHDGGALFMVQ